LSLVRRGGKTHPPSAGLKRRIAAGSRSDAPRRYPVIMDRHAVMPSTAIPSRLTEAQRSRVRRSRSEIKTSDPQASRELPSGS